MYNAPAMRTLMATRRWASALAVLALAATCASALAGVETDLEQGIGDFLAQAFIAQRGRLSQPPIEEWIDGMGAELLEVTPRQDLHYRFIILDSPEANGFALPGGWVFLTAGLLESARGDDEIASVMAHELAHLVDRDFQRVTARGLLWLGVTELVREGGRDDLVPLVQGAALVNILRHSRRQEAQADDVGAGIAWDAGYDPTTLIDFLGTEPGWSYLETVFATHPHPERRGEWIRERVAQLRADDPEGALGVARSLLQRGRATRARQMLEQPLGGGLEAQRVALLARAEALAAQRARDGSAPAALSDADLTALASAQASIDRARERDEATRAGAWRRLRAMWDDAQIERALLVAQAFDPELTDVAYLALLAQTVDLMHRAARGGNLVARTLSLRAGAVLGARELAGDLSHAHCAPGDLPVLQATAAATVALSDGIAAEGAAEMAELARLAAEYHEAARMVAPLLLELASAGEGDPMGRLVFSRFMITQAQVTMLAARIARLDGACDALAAGTWRAAIDVYRLRLNLAGVTAASGARPGLLCALARRAGSSAGRLKDSWRATGALGDAVVDQLDRRLVPDEREFGSALRSTQIVIRLSFLDAKEQGATGPKGNPTSEGADTVALRGAVGHPQ